MWSWLRGIETAKNCIAECFKKISLNLEYSFYHVVPRIDLGANQQNVLCPQNAKTDGRTIHKCIL